jgi:hypothetical protein
LILSGFIMFYHVLSIGVWEIWAKPMSQAGCPSLGFPPTHVSPASWRPDA